MQIFDDINTKQMTEQKLFYLKQTKLVAAYITKFQQIAVKIEWKDEILTAKYYKGFKDSVKDKIIKTNWPEKLDKMIKKSIIINNCQYKCWLEYEEKLSQWSFADQDNRSQEKHHKSYQSKKHRHQD